MTIHRTIYERAVFFDTGAFVSLRNKKDQHHDVALSCLATIQDNKYPAFSSNLTVIETHKRLLFDIGEHSALYFIQEVLTSGINILIMTEEDELEGRRIVEKFKGQNFTLYDAINFSIMKRNGISKAFGFDKHTVSSDLI